MPVVANLCEAAYVALEHAKQSGENPELLSIDAQRMGNDGLLSLTNEPGRVGILEPLSMGWTFGFRYSDGGGLSLRYHGSTLIALAPSRVPFAPDAAQRALVIEALPTSEALVPGLHSRRCSGDKGGYFSLSYRWSAKENALEVEYAGFVSHIRASLSEAMKLDDLQRACR